MVTSCTQILELGTCPRSDNLVISCRHLPTVEIFGSQSTITKNDTCTGMVKPKNPSSFSLVSFKDSNLNSELKIISLNY